MTSRLAAKVLAIVLAAGPAFAQSQPPVAEEPIPVPAEAPQGSSGPGSGSAALGSVGGAVILFGLVAVVTLGAIAALANAD